MDLHCGFQLFIFNKSRENRNSPIALRTYRLHDEDTDPNFKKSFKIVQKLSKSNLIPFFLSSLKCTLELLKSCVFSPKTSKHNHSRKSRQNFNLIVQLKAIKMTTQKEVFQEGRYEIEKKKLLSY